MVSHLMVATAVQGRWRYKVVAVFVQWRTGITQTMDIPTAVFFALHRRMRVLNFRVAWCQVDFVEMLTAKQT